MSATSSSRWPSLASDVLTPHSWLSHMVATDHCGEYLEEGGSLVRIVSTPDEATHAQLVDALRRVTEDLQIGMISVSHHNCDQLQYPHKIVAALGEQIELRDLFHACAAQVWRRLGYPPTGVTAREVSDRHGGSLMDLRSDFRSEVRRMFDSETNLSRDFRSAIPRILEGVLDGPHQERIVIGQFQSFLLGTLSARDLFQIGIQKKVNRETATETLRNLLALVALANRTGAVLHLDLRRVTDHELVAQGGRLVFATTKQARIWVYQWIRELIDGLDRFSSAFIVVEFGPSFPDPSFAGRGWGLYDALRLRLQDGVHPVDGKQNPSAPFVSLGSR